jgi:uncharacterized membrane protein (UPF0127 family)
VAGLTLRLGRALGGAHGVRLGVARGVRFRVALGVGVVVGVGVVIAGCATDATDRRSLSPGDVPPSLLGRPLTMAQVGDLEFLVAVADTPESRRRGLMHVDDFGAVQGMVFVFDAPTETGFYMKDVPVPLDIAFVGADGALLEVLTMPLCTAEPCPLFRSPAPFLWAIETPAGGLAGIAPGDRFSLRP